MRNISKARKAKRGCGYCTEFIPRDKKNSRKPCRCPHDKCPYTELDEFETYSGYVNSVSDIPIETLIAILCGDSRIRKKFALKSHKSVI